MLVAHLLSLGFVLGVMTLADKEAFSWIRGRKETLEPSTLRQYHLLVWLGLGALVFSGAYLLYPRWGELLSQPLFVIKLLFVAILFVNGFLIGRLQGHATARSWASLPLREKIELLASGAISLISWAAAAALGLYLFY